ncbi:MAG: hypothetical protein GEU83_20430 [Pseudonocardiaceae bacterium]|nr:hypothetical protein [Pseudonocardiaceae bacterium]
MTYQTLAGLNPRAFTDAARELSRCAARLGREYRQYKSHVMAPLQRKDDWRGGGQPSAAVVATVNGLAIDTLRLRIAAGSITYTYLAAGMATAQQELAVVEHDIEADELTIDGDGTVFNPRWWVVDDGTRAQKITAYQHRLDRILAFATNVDLEAARRLGDCGDLPVTTQVATAGVLEQAKRDHADAAGDIQQAVDAVDSLIATAARSGVTFEAGDLPDVPSLIPSGATAAAASAGVLFGRLAPPPTKGTHYDLDYDLGKSRHGPKELFTMLRNRFAELFPFTGAPAKLREGQRVDLGAYGQRFPVVASRITATGWTFNTLPGHIDYPGKIEFNIVTGPDGHARLQIRGTCTPLCGNPVYQRIGRTKWDQLSENMRKAAAN